MKSQKGHEQAISKADAVQTFEPFFDRWLDLCSFKVMDARVWVPLVLAASFILPHVLFHEPAIAERSTWLLGLIIAVTAYCLFLATGTMRELMTQIDNRLGEGINPTSARFRIRLFEVLSDRNLITGTTGARNTDDSCPGN